MELSEEKIYTQEQIEEMYVKSAKFVRLSDYKALEFQLQTNENGFFVMLKDWFTESDDGHGGKILLAECPNCGDTVIYNKDCIACDAVFEFKAFAFGSKT